MAASDTSAPGATGSRTVARSARLVAHKEPLRVEEVELAAPGPDEVLIDLAYAGVNPIDRYGILGTVAPDAPVPRTAGGEASGLVDGRRYMLRGSGLGTRRDGLWATRAVVPEEALIEIPEGVGLQEAAAMGVAGVTAWRSVTEKANLTADDRALVLGAAGGVGSIIVSLAKSIGATVWGQTGSEDKAGWITDRGADRVIVGDEGAVVDACKELQPTVVFDPLGGSFTGAAIESLSNRGRLVIFGASAGLTGEVPLQMLYRKALDVTGYGGLIYTDDEMNAAIREALKGLAEGRFEVPIGRVLPLDEVNEALRLLADRQILGKVLLDLAG